MLTNSSFQSLLQLFARRCGLASILAATILIISPALLANTSTGQPNAMSYRWNLRDTSQPLLSLPDHPGGSIDVMLRYSLGDYDLPLFQTLHFNSRSGKYMLMVFANDERRVEFVQLTGNNSNFVSEERFALRLQDKGRVKVLTAKDGTRYAFTKFADGEFRCSSIEDRGSVLNLKYSSDASLSAIADHAGRMVSFSYSNDHLVAISQTWGQQSPQMTKTWALATHEQLHNNIRPDISLGPLVPKIVPSNAVTSRYTTEMMASDRALADIFGGTGAIAAANGFEPRALENRYPYYRGDLVGDNGRILPGHLSYAMHLYGSPDGTNETDLYVPAGFTSYSKVPTRTDAAVTFYYPRLGTLTNVTLAVFHVSGFGLVNEGARVRIGKIGGPGGSIGTYKHAHLEFYRGNTGLPRSSARHGLRINPADVLGSSSVARNR